jgi:hypothetical protein
MNLPILSLNKKITNFLEEESAITLGLAGGKMGLCIYFYILSQTYKNISYKKTAAKLLDEIFENIDAINTYDVKTGLAGIGLGIDYLIKNDFVKGNANEILSDVDDLIFKHLTYSRKIDFSSQIHILYYLCIRFKDRKEGGENQYLHKELIIQTINNLYEHLPTNFQEEPLTYTTDYILPQLLFILSEIYRLDFYNHRLVKIIEEVSYSVLSIFPLLDSNKLYLLWAMNTLNTHIQNKHWQKHIDLLKENIDLNIILNHELRNKNIYFNDGLTSICFFVNKLIHYFDNKELKLFRMQAISKIENSQIWTLLNDNQQYFEKYIGLYEGFTGVFLLIHKLRLINP